MSLLLLILAGWTALSLLALPVLALIGRAGEQADRVAHEQHRALLEERGRRAQERHETVGGTSPVAHAL